MDDFSYEDYLAHEGILRRSGRYPWGSGANPHQRNRAFLDYVDDLKKQGMSEKDIAQGMGISTGALRAAKSIAKTDLKQRASAQAQMLKEKGLSNIAIGEKMGIGESSVRDLLDPALKDKLAKLDATSNMLKDQVAQKELLDIGVGTENQLGISGSALATAVAKLKEEGYRVDKVKVPIGRGNDIEVKVLSAPGTEYKYIVNNKDKIQTVSNYSEDSGRTFLGIETPTSISSKRIGVRYADEGGADKDGVIELRRGVEDLSLGQSRYAQVRIAVDDTHYLKGMAMYSDNMPDGVDIVFNTNKSKKASKLDAMKPMKEEAGEIDEDNPFGSIIRQKHYTDSKGARKLSPLNIVGSEKPDGTSISGEEGGWYPWSKTLSSQMLSKQSPTLAKQQLDIAYDAKKTEYDEIMALTNPAVKKKLLQSFADDADSSAGHLKAAGLPRTRNHVILPINSLKDNEIYAPNYRNGETVVLIRHPHGGKFEIPELTVNNRNREANSVIKNAKDAVGINSKVAARLSGADFDGDTVLVIPNNSGSVKTTPPLAALKDFNPQKMYPGYEGMKVLGSKGGPSKQREMGDVSNLITDMTIKGAPHSEIARAVKHSMVVIDAEKHKLDYKLSAKMNGIAELKTKYQKSATGGASTVVSQARGKAYVMDRKPRPQGEGGAIDPLTGKKMYVNTGKTYVDKSGREQPKTFQSTKMAETDDANTLSSGTPMEVVYATHANKLKALANTARKSEYNLKMTPYNQSARVVYSPQVNSLKAKLNIAQKNAPQERRARLLANTMVKAKKQANPDMDAETLKKISTQALNEARNRTGARKQRIEITPIEWEAIQTGAISTNFLNNILANADLDTVKQLAMPREASVMKPAVLRRAQNMAALGYSQAEIADQLGINVSTLNSALTE